MPATTLFTSSPDLDIARQLGIPDPNRPQPAADAKRAALYRYVLAIDPPGPWTQDRWTQTSKYAGVPAIAINAIGDWLSGSTVQVQEEREEERKPGMPSRPGLKKAFSAAGEANDEEYEPLEEDSEEDEILSELFEYINPTDTFPEFAKQWVIQGEATGNVMIWTPLDQTGKPHPKLGMYILPSALLQYIPMSPQYPEGGWRLMGSLSWASVGIPYAANVPLDARQVLHFRNPGPLWRWDGMSSMQLMSRYIDGLDGIDISRDAGMRYGLNPDAVVAIEGATQQQLEAINAEFQARHGGAENQRRVLFTSGEGTSVDLLGRANKEMDYQTSWEQMVKAVLAGFGVPPSVAGLVEAGNYAAYYAALRQFFSNKLQPYANRMSAFLTKHLARKYWGRNKCVKVKLPKLDDPTLLIQQHSFQPNDVYLLNEHRAALDLPPIEGGDVLPSVYMAQQQQAMQPQAAPGADSYSGPAPGQGHPLDAVGDGILEALGVKGGDGASENGDQPQNGTPFGKAFKLFDEAKHRRGQPGNKGQFGNGAQQNGNSVSRPSAGDPGQAGPPGNKPATPLPPEAANHPAVKGALQRLTEKASTIASSVLVKMQGAGLTPETVIGNQSAWETWFVTQHADAVANTLGVDAMTAAGVLSHLVAHAVTAIQSHLRGGADRAQPGQQQSGPVGRPAPNTEGAGHHRQDGSDGGPPRPANRLGGGSLPPRMKALPGDDLAGLVDSLWAEAVGGT